MKLRSTLVLPFLTVLFACSGGSDPSTSSSPSTTDADGSTASETESPTESGKPKDPSATDAGKRDSGSGAPPEATGLEGFCEHYFECGGTTYADAKACIDDAEGYWGTCKRPELDAFGTCMMNVSCEDWSPNAYNPASTPCATQWKAILDKDC